MSLSPPWFWRFLQLGALFSNFNTRFPLVICSVVPMKVFSFPLRYWNAALIVSQSKAVAYQRQLPFPRGISRCLPQINLKSPPFWPWALKWKVVNIPHSWGETSVSEHSSAVTRFCKLDGSLSIGLLRLGLYAIQDVWNLHLELKGVACCFTLPFLNTTDL